MKAIAAEVGLDPALIERASRLVPGAASNSLLARLVGGPIKHRLSAHFGTKLTEQEAAHLLTLVRAAVEDQGEGEANSAGVSWNSGNRPMFVTAHNEGDGSRVLITVDRRSALVGTAILSAVGAFVVVSFGVALSDEFVGAGVVAALVVGGGLAGVLALARRWWGSTTRRVREKVAGVMDAFSRSLAESKRESASSEETGGPQA